MKRAERGRTVIVWLLMAPSVLYLFLTFLLPVFAYSFRSIDNRDLVRALPRTAVSIKAWDGTGLPSDEIFAAVVDDVRALERPEAAVLGRRLNYNIPGFRGMIINLYDSKPDPSRPARDFLLLLDPHWGEATYWQTIRSESGILTPFFLLSASDLSRVDGELNWPGYHRAIYLQAFVRTFWISAGVTVLCLFLGFPVAVLLASTSTAMSNLLVMLVLLPFWTSVLVRTTAWVILLRQKGVVNEALMSWGILTEPANLIFNRTGVFIAMTHVLLPFMILPLYSVLKGIPRDHMKAAASLGAKPWSAFREVYVPQAMPGVIAGCTLVFITSVGFYITPVLVGGGGDRMISYFIAFFTNESVNWGMASALALLLLLLVALICSALGRFLKFGGMGT